MLSRAKSEALLLSLIGTRKNQLYRAILIQWRAHGTFSGSVDGESGQLDFPTYFVFDPIIVGKVDIRTKDSLKAILPTRPFVCVCALVAKTLKIIQDRKNDSNFSDVNAVPLSETATGGKLWRPMATHSIKTHPAAELPPTW